MSDISSSDIATKDPYNALVGDIENTFAHASRDHNTNKHDQSQERLQEFALEAMVEDRATSQGDLDDLFDRKLKSMKTDTAVPVTTLRPFQQFAEEAREEHRPTLDNYEENLQPMTTDGIVANNMPEDSTRMMVGDEPETRTQTNATPGAVAIMGIGSHLMVQSNQFSSSIDVDDYTAPGTTDTTLRQMEEQEIHYATATLVVDEDSGSTDLPVVASATKIDTEAIEQAGRRRQIRAVLISFVLAIAAGGIAYAIYASTRPNAQPVTVAPSPNILNTPNENLTLSPSASPSTMLFAFIADKSFDDGAALFSPGSSQQQAMAWIEGKDTGTLLNDEGDLLQLYSLATLYYATSGSGWNQFSSNADSSPWLVGINYCSWEGVACNANRGSLTSLDLNNRSLVGSLPVEIGHLSGLANLDLGVNTLSGTLPSEIGLLTSLTDCQVHNNLFSGPLPSEVGQLSVLTKLIMSVNQFSGMLTTEIGRLTALTELYIYTNQFKGSLPTEIGLMRRLASFDIQKNMMSGKVPTEIGRLTALIDLGFAENEFSGSIPSEIGLLTDMTILYVFNNKFAGSLPTEIGKLYSLIEFSAYTNQFLSGTLCTEIGLLSNLEFLSVSSNELSGTIPTEIGLLTHLTFLQLFKNKFAGTIPTEIGHLTVLTELQFSSNSLSGPFPTEIGKLTSLINLDLSFNGFLNGTLPSEIGLLTLLSGMRLANNSFNDMVPLEIGNMINLEVVSLYQNQFSGNLPTEIANLLSLTTLNLYKNNFTGTIPVGIQHLTNLITFDLSINQFKGILPTEIGLLTELTFLGSFTNQLSGKIPSEIGKLVSLTGLYLNDNQFSSTLPMEIGQLYNLGEANFSENTDLTGTVPVEVCRASASLVITHCPPLACNCSNCELSAQCQ